MKVLRSAVTCAANKPHATTVSHRYSVLSARRFCPIREQCTTTGEVTAPSNIGRTVLRYRGGGGGMSLEFEWIPEWNGMEWILGMEWTEGMAWNGRPDNRMPEWNGMDWKQRNVMSVVPPPMSPIMLPIGADVDIRSGLPQQSSGKSCKLFVPACSG